MKRSIHNLAIVAIFTLVLPLGGAPKKLFGAAQTGQAWRVTIEGLEPTVFFPRQPAGQPLQERAILRILNPAWRVHVVATITVGDRAPFDVDLGIIETSWGTIAAIPVLLPEISAPCKVKVVIRDKDFTAVIDTREFNWQPQKKWKLFCVSYSHHDLGYGNYPHRIRTEIRHGNIERPLEFCRRTDSWDEDSKYRFMIETAEPITSFISSHSEAEAADLARRIREGRIQVGGFHNTAETEQLSEELMARLYYLGLRHTPDLLGVPPGKTVQIDDVIALTWPLATYMKEAGVSYLFHGHNGNGESMRPASDEPVWHWEPPDGDTEHAVMVRSDPYGGYGHYVLEDTSGGRLAEYITKWAAWPYDSLLLQDGTDFQLATIDLAEKIHDWNAKYSYPHIICSTMDMFFDSIAAQAKPGQIKGFARDGNNEWDDEDGTDAWALGIARRQGEFIPTVEKFSTIATALTGGGYPWVDLYQAYHRVLNYHEHTNAIDFLNNDRERAQQYETELVENREMVSESREFAEHALEASVPKLTRLIKTTADKNIVVFNPLAWKRTDVVKFSTAGLGSDFHIVDGSTGKDVPHQALSNSEAIFIAADVPSVGYKTFSIQPGGARAAARPARGNVLENRYYRLEFDPTTGAITSIQDKELKQELVDASAPQRFNEYLYERYESPEPGVPSTWYRVSSARVSATRGPVASVITIKASAVGVDSMQQTVVLYNDLKRIDFTLDMVKSPSGVTGGDYLTQGFKNKESVYVALPLAIPDFEIKHELPGAVAEPIRQQFSGSNTAYYGVRHFTDVSNSHFGVTVSSPDIAMINYGRPRSNPVLPHLEGAFEMKMEYPTNSRVYLYLLDNMCSTNIRLDQRGPISFSWSMRSHPGHWQQGDADQFGWQVLNRLLPRVVDGRNSGTLPATSSFLSVDKPNIALSTIKPAEANGAGIILRFNETKGVATEATVTLPFLDGITSANETSVVEVDRQQALRMINGDEISFSIRPFGVKTIRVVCKPKAPLPAVSGLAAKPLSDMEVKLSWRSSPDEASRISHFNLYRGTSGAFEPSLMNLVASPSSPSYTDRPQLNYGGWINRRLEPETTYYYRIAPVDRWNNLGPLSPVIAVKTLKSSEKNAVPVQVQCLSAILVGQITPQNYINLLFRTNPETDVHLYEIHRSNKAAFEVVGSTRIGMADANAIVKGSTMYGHVPIDHRMGEYDHMMYQDDTVQPSSTYYYRVCAVDDAGQRGPCSAEASVRTK